VQLIVYVFRLVFCFTCILFDPEDGGDMFSRIMGWLSLDFEALLIGTMTVLIMRLLLQQ
jgi:hypothetical protein